MSVFRRLIILIVSISVYTQSSFAAETIDWLTVPYPPAYLADGKGCGDIALKYFTEHLPEYGHASRQVPLVRVGHEFSNEKLACTPNLAGKADRYGDKAVSTVAPSYLMPPSGIVIRKEDARLFNNGDPLLLKELLKNEKLRCGFPRGAIIGVNIPMLVKENDKNVDWINETEPDKFFQLLFADPKRIDYFPLHAFSFKHYAKNLSLQDKAIFVPVIEESEPIPTRPFCQNTEAGKKMIEKLEKLQKTPEFKKAVIENCLIEYLPENMQSEYRKINGLKE
jgi:uncharacterized protein (TIGR02285 family)